MSDDDAQRRSATVRFCFLISGRLSPPIRSLLRRSSLYVVDEKQVLRG